MSESATTNRRERRMRETAAHLTSVSRRLTAERGLSGFTIEEVCDEVDVSRRTFFNYFASKEEAILGVDPEEESQRFADDFLARDAAGWPAVMDDLIDLVIVHFEAGGVDAAGHAALHAAIEREPALLVRFMGLSRERERQTVALVARRQGIAPDDPRAEAAVAALTTLVRSAADRFLAPGNTREFSTILREALAALRVVLSPPSA